MKREGIQMAKNTTPATTTPATPATKSAIDIVRDNVATLIKGTTAADGLKAQRYIKTLIGLKRNAKQDEERKVLESLIVELQGFRNKSAKRDSGKVKSAWYAADYRKDIPHGVATYAPIK
jgi:hypothetical protein